MFSLLTSQARWRKPQQGAALITMLVVVLLITMVATRIQTNFFKTLLGAQSAATKQQATYLLQSVVDVAELALAADTTEGYDTLTDFWAVQQPPMPVVGGLMSARMIDAQSLFNLNALVTPATEQEQFSEPQRVFIRLLQAIPDAQIDLLTAQNITLAIKDWLDTDQDTSGSMGAEDGYYVSEAGYRAANKPMRSATELKQIRHITLAQYHLVKPFVVALPTANLKINVNTAPLALLRAINIDSQLIPLPADQAEQWVLDRDTSAFTQISAFDQSPTYRQLASAGNVDAGALVTTADWVTLQADLNLEGRWFFATALAQREGDKLSLKLFTEGEL